MKVFFNVARNKVLIFKITLLSFLIIPGLLGFGNFSSQKTFTNEWKSVFDKSDIASGEIIYRSDNQKDKSGSLNPRLLIDLSHHTYFGDHDPRVFFSSFIILVESIGFEVTVGADFSNIDQYDVVVILLPQIGYSEKEVNSIVDFLDNQGIFLLFGEWGPHYTWEYDAVNNLLMDLNAGIQMNSSQVDDSVNFDTYYYWPVARDFKEHCLTENLSQILHPKTTYLLVNNSESSLYRASEYSSASGVDGPFTLAAIADPAARPDWKFLVVADMDVFSSYDNDYLNMHDNRQLAINAVIWCPCLDDLQCDDGVFCNGTEYCIGDVAGRCVDGEIPCPDDLMFCNGTNICDEQLDQCIEEDNDCPDDGLWCNGQEYCDEGDDRCARTEAPCKNQQCVEQTDECLPYGVDDDDDADSGEEELWPKGDVTGGCCGC